MRFLLALFVVLTFTSACDGGEKATAQPAADLVIRCGTLIDGLAKDVSRDQLIVVREQRFASITPFNAAAVPAGEFLDLGKHTCLPGLIDTHVHLDTLPEDADDYTIYLRRSLADMHTLAETNAATVLRAGFTTIRHTGSYVAWIDRDVRDRIREGEIVGPRISVGGPYLTIPHGGGDMYIPGIEDERIPAYYREGVARGAEEFRAKAVTAVAQGTDFIKVIASGAVFGYGGVPGAPEMTRDEIAAVVEVAHAAGIKVTAHAHGAASIKDAILAGVDSIEHASLGDDESIALALEHDVAFSMDIYNGTYTEEVGTAQNYAEEFMRKNEETTEAQRRVFVKAHRAGVALLFGTDLGVLPHDMGARQFVVMVKHGMSPMEAIQSATSVAADRMGMKTQVGAVEVGRFADLVAVAGNPLDDISLLQSIDIVIKGGKKVLPGN
jgi:imidazolonepropionase-like amidohydrolase